MVLCLCLCAHPCHHMVLCLYLHHSWPTSNWSRVRLWRASKYEFTLKKVNLTIAVIGKLCAPFSTPLKNSDRLVVIAPYRRPPLCASVHFSLFSASRYLCAAGLTLRINSNVASNFQTWFALAALHTKFFNSEIFHFVLTLLATWWRQYRWWAWGGCNQVILVSSKQAFIPKCRSEMMQRLVRSVTNRFRHAKNHPHVSLLSLSTTANASG